MQMNNSRLKRVWGWVRLLMGILGIAVLLALVDPDEVSEALHTASWEYLLPAWLMLMLSTAAKTYRWYLLLKQKQVPMPFTRLFGTYMIGGFYGQFLPGSSAGGDAMRIAESAVDTGRGVDSVTAVVVERAVGLVSILVTASLILLIGKHEDIPTTFKVVIYTLSLIGITGLAILRFGWFVPTIINLMERFKLGHFAEKVQSLSAAFRGDLDNWGVLAQMSFMSLVANFFSMSAYYLVLLAVVEPVPYFSFISLVALIVTIEAIPLTPGALGVREGAYVFFLNFLGVVEHDALLIGLLIRLLTWSQAMLGGMVLLGRGLRKNTAAAASPDLRPGVSD